MPPKILLWLLLLKYCLLCSQRGVSLISFSESYFLLQKSLEEQLSSWKNCWWKQRGLQHKTQLEWKIKVLAFSFLRGLQSWRAAGKIAGGSEGFRKGRTKGFSPAHQARECQFLTRGKRESNGALRLLGQSKIDAAGGQQSVLKERLNLEPMALAEFEEWWPWVTKSQLAFLVVIEHMSVNRGGTKL